MYVHIPFCRTKCGYCDFFSVVLKDRDSGPLVSGIVRELEHRLAESPHQVRTIFLGGGTPTLLPLPQLSTLLETLGHLLPVQSLREFTVEANPATVQDDKARLLAGSGVTRVSVGAQSFVRDELAVLERIHAPEDVARSMLSLRRHGIQQVNLDLIFAIPGQTLDSWNYSLERTIELNPDHISCYGLTYEVGTPLTRKLDRGQLRRCPEELEARMVELAMDALPAAGYEQYEISAFAKPGCRSLHNLIYWRNEPYIGVGPSAAGCSDGRRYKNVADVAGYIRMMESQGHAEVESETIDVPKLTIELIMMQLRLNEGLCIQVFRERTGLDPLAVFGGALDRLRNLGRLHISATHIALTRAGRMVADSVMAELVVACEESRGSGAVLPSTCSAC